MNERQIQMDYKRITILCGHYGSGKTNIAVNMAFDLKKRYNKVSIADLDIVNPYFRTKDSRDELEAANIKLISSEYAGTNVDIPALPAEMYSLTDDKSTMALLDIGGDDRGALALGRLAPQILEENNYEILAVINMYRPLTPDAESTAEVLYEIERAMGMRFTGVINNSNLGEATEAKDVLDSVQYADAVCKRLSLPLYATTVCSRLYDSLKDKIDNLFPLNLQKKIN